MAAVRAVANVTHATNGTVATEACLSTHADCLTEAIPDAIIEVAAAVLAPNFRCRKNNRLHPPIIYTFQLNISNARVRLTLGAARKSR